jgi:hypothetical protein
MSDLNRTLKIELTIAEAIVLNDFIENSTELNAALASNPAAQRALWNLQCLLAQQLTEPFIDDYPKVLAESIQALSQEK